MSEIEVRSIASIATEPWRNGGGITRTLATSGNQWRVSLAEIGRDGPYSRFDGMSRLSLVLRGNGVVLRDGNTVVRLDPFEAVEYDGDVAWHATLVDGPVTALNVMWQKGRCRVDVRTIVEPWVVPPDCAAVVLSPGNGCKWSEAGTGLCGTVDAEQMLVAEHVNRPLSLAPAVPAADERDAAHPVLVTIEAQAPA